MILLLLNAIFHKLQFLKTTGGESNVIGRYAMKR